MNTTTKQQLEILENYILNSEDFRMDCTPIPLTDDLKKRVLGGEYVE